MTAKQEIEAIRSKFVAGEIPIDELRLHVEPILNERIVDRASDRQMREVMNAIELAIYTKPEPQRTELIANILTSAMELLGDT
jgi:hypothetical protein